MKNEAELLQELNSNLKQIKLHLQRHTQHNQEDISEYEDQSNAEKLINQLTSL